MTLGSTQPLLKWVTGTYPGGKGVRCVRLKTSPSSCAECHENMGAYTSWNPLGHTGSVKGQLYLICFRRQNAYASEWYCPTKQERWRSCRMHTAISQLEKTSEANRITLHAVFWNISPPPTPQLLQVGQDLFVIETSRSHRRQSVGLLRTSDRPVYLTTHNRKASMPPAGFKPTIPASELPQTHASDHVATRIGCCT